MVLLSELDARTVGADDQSPRDGFYLRPRAPPYLHAIEPQNPQTTKLEPMTPKEARNSGAPLLMRLAVENGRLVTSRPLAVLAALISRLLRQRAYALWPDVAHPSMVADLGYPPAPSWLVETFESRRPRKGLRRLLSPATLSALRARGLATGPPSELVLEAFERGVGRPPERPRLALYSTTGEAPVKVMCLVFAGGDRSPSVVVKMIPDREFSFRLRLETEVVEKLRERIGGSKQVADALPLPPLHAGEIRGDYLVVQQLDPFAGKTSREDRTAALDWLRAFQSATSLGNDHWSADDDERELKTVRDAWRRARPEAETRVAARVSELLAELRGQPLIRCGVHGDFWRGNIAHEQGRLRVYDWEWAQEIGTPFFDIWMYELGPIRLAEPLGEWLERSLDRVRQELEARSIDPKFALATLAPAMGHFVFRERDITGSPGTGEENAGSLLEAAERVLLK